MNCVRPAPCSSGRQPPGAKSPAQARACGEHHPGPRVASRILAIRAWSTPSATSRRAARPNPKHYFLSLSGAGMTADIMGTKIPIRSTHQGRTPFLNCFIHGEIYRQRPT